MRRMRREIRVMMDGEFGEDEIGDDVEDDEDGGEPED